PVVVSWPLHTNAKAFMHTYAQGGWNNRCRGRERGQQAPMQENEMKPILMLAVSTVALGIGAGAAYAECGIEAGSVRILSNDFEALRVINTTAQECASDAVTVTANATAEHKEIQVPALTINPAEYTVAVVANNSIVPLLND